MNLLTVFEKLLLSRHQDNHGIRRCYAQKAQTKLCGEINYTKDGCGGGGLVHRPRFRKNTEVRIWY